jgi:hypothetical protein
MLIDRINMPRYFVEYYKIYQMKILAKQYKHIFEYSSRI